MKKEYIFPVVDMIDINTMDILAGSPPYDDEEDLEWDEDDPKPDPEHGDARCRSDYGSNSDFGSLW